MYPAEHALARDRNAVFAQPSVLLEPVAPSPTGRRVRIQYIDASWRRTERVIEPLRTFRLDRIASWVVEDVQERVAARPPASPFGAHAVSATSCPC